MVLKKARVFLELYRLKGVIVTLFYWLPCLWVARVLYEKGLCPFPLLIKEMLFMLCGALSMRGFGCAFNDYIHKNTDALEARSKKRPIPTKRLTLNEARLAIVLALSVCLALWCFLSTKAKFTSLLFLGVTLLYPFSKKFFWAPQLVLGLAINGGIFVTFFDLCPNMPMTKDYWLLYVRGIFWTLCYDTIYGFMDIHDDKKNGVKSLSIVIEMCPKYALYLLNVGLYFSYPSTSSFMLSCLFIFFWNPTSVPSSRKTFLLHSVLGFF